MEKYVGKGNVLMKNSKIIAFSGVLSALSFVIISLGTVISVFAYIAPVLAGLVLISAIKNINNKSAWLIFIVVSVLTFLFMPDKECSLTYIFFFGYYPIIKPYIEKQKNKVISFLVKIIIFNLGIITSQLICFYVFGIPFDDFLGKWGVIILLVLANIMFVLYDKMLYFVEILYMKKLYNIIKRLFR